MTNEINIDGDDNVVISQVVGSQITLNKFLGDSDDYQKSVNHLNDKKKLLSLIKEEDPDERVRLSKEIAELEEQLTSLRQGVINLAKTFKALEEKPEININNTRLEKAKEHFIAGRFTESRTILEQEIEAINDERKVLLGHKAEFEEKKAEFEKEEGWYKENVQPKLEYKAYEYLILAQTTALNYESSTRIADTKKYFEDSIECAASFENLFAYGYFLDKLSEFKRAIDFLQSALEIARKNNDKQGEGSCRGNLGVIFVSLGEYQKAIEFQEQRLKIACELGDRHGEGQALGNLGLAYFSLGEYQKAIEFHEQTLKIARELGDHLGEGRALGNLGLAYYLLDEDQKAIEFQEQSLKIAREIGDRLLEGHSLGSLGSIYQSLEEYQKSIEFQEQRLKIARELGNRLGEGNGLGGLGIAYFSLKEYQKAIEFYEGWLKIASEIGDRMGEGQSLANLGLAYIALGDKGKACGYWGQSLVIFEAIGVPQVEIVREFMQEAGCLEENS